MTSIIAFMAGMALVAVCLGICVREVLIVYYNPIPKFDDGDGDEHRSIPFVKTRRIGYYDRKEALYHGEGNRQ